MRTALTLRGSTKPNLASNSAGSVARLCLMS
jgi:hypothetical protein